MEDLHLAKVLLHVAFIRAGHVAKPSKEVFVYKITLASHDGNELFPDESSCCFTFDLVEGRVRDGFINDSVHLCLFLLILFKLILQLLQVII